jgi:hypothetical protein
VTRFHQAEAERVLAPLLAPEPPVDQNTITLTPTTSEVARTKQTTGVHAIAALLDR